uniref:tetratricopeptide repeat protein 28-like n=1 Tax=Myxine glutinosa TaxID=7769 RepID=UPI00358E4CC3
MARRRETSSVDFPECLVILSQLLVEQPGKEEELACRLWERALNSPLAASLELAVSHLSLSRSRSPSLLAALIGRELLVAGHTFAAVTVLGVSLRMSGDEVYRCWVLGHLGAAHLTLAAPMESLSCHRLQLLMAMKLKDKSAAWLALCGLGEAYSKLSQHQAAIAALRQAVCLGRQAVRLGRQSLPSETRLDNLGNRSKQLCSQAITLDRKVECLGGQSQQMVAQARVLGRLGVAYLASGDLDAGKDIYREMLELSQQLSDPFSEVRAWLGLGDIALARPDPQSARAAYFHALSLLSRESVEKQVKDEEKTKEGGLEQRALASLGRVERFVGNLAKAATWHRRQLQAAMLEKDGDGQAQACCLLGAVEGERGAWDVARHLAEAELALRRRHGDRAALGRAHGSLGLALGRCGSWDGAARHLRIQLQLALACRDSAAEASAHGNLAAAYQYLGHVGLALSHRTRHVTLVASQGRLGGLARALANLGQLLTNLGHLSAAARAFTRCLALPGCNDGSAIRSRVLSGLGYTCLKLGRPADAAACFRRVLAERGEKLGEGAGKDKVGIKKGNVDLQKEKNVAEPVSELGKKENGDWKTSRAQYMKLDMDKGTAAGFKCFNSAVIEGSSPASEAREGASEQKQNVIEPKGQRPMEGGRPPLDPAVFCNFSLALWACGDEKGAEEAMKRFLEEAKTRGDRARGLGNLGDLCSARGDWQGAFELYERQLSEARAADSHADEAAAYAGLASACRALGQMQQALSHLTLHLQACQELNDPMAEARAQARLGAAYSELGRHSAALTCFCEQLEAVERYERENSGREGKTGERSAALGNLGRARLSLGLWEQAAKCFREQLEQLDKDDLAQQRGQINEDNTRRHLSLQGQSMRRTGSLQGPNERMSEKARAYRGLACALRSMGHEEEAQVVLSDWLATNHSYANQSQELISPAAGDGESFGRDVRIRHRAGGDGRGFDERARGDGERVVEDGERAGGDGQGCWETPGVDCMRVVEDDERASGDGQVNGDRPGGDGEPVMGDECGAMERALGDGERAASSGDRTMGDGERTVGDGERTDMSRRAGRGEIQAALRDILQSGEAARDALRVLLHLTEKALQRLAAGHSNPMYTSQASVARKARDACGWPRLLAALGFRFEPAIGSFPHSVTVSSPRPVTLSGELSTRSLPPSLFFPRADPGGWLRLASMDMQALLGLPRPAFHILLNLLPHWSTGKQAIELLQEVLHSWQPGGLEPPTVTTQTEEVSFCFPLLQAIGVEVVTTGGQEERTERSDRLTFIPASHRSLKVALMALKAIFGDCQDGPSPTISIESIPPDSPTLAPPSPARSLDSALDSLSLHSCPTRSSSPTQSLNQSTYIYNSSQCNTLPHFNTPNYKRYALDHANTSANLNRVDHINTRPHQAAVMHTKNKGNWSSHRYTSQFSQLPINFQSVAPPLLSRPPHSMASHFQSCSPSSTLSLLSSPTLSPSSMPCSPPQQPLTLNPSTDSPFRRVSRSKEKGQDIDRKL